jgi:hypothetical protein
MAAESKKTELRSMMLVFFVFIFVIDASFYLRRAFRLLPSDEVYSNSILFQILSFLLTRGIMWLFVIIIFVVIFEIVASCRKWS